MPKPFKGHSAQRIATHIAGHYVEAEDFPVDARRWHDRRSKLLGKPMAACFDAFGRILYPAVTN
jgi:hypothetical protein